MVLSLLHKLQIKAVANPLPTIITSSNSLSIDIVDARYKHQDLFEAESMMASIAFWAMFAYERCKMMLSVVVSPIAAVWNIVFHGESDLAYSLIFWGLLFAYVYSIFLCTGVCLRVIRHSDVKHRRVGIGRVHDYATQPGSFVVPAVIAFCCTLYFFWKQLRLSYRAWDKELAILEDASFIYLQSPLPSEGAWLWQLNWGGWLRHNNVIAELVTLDHTRASGNWWSEQVWSSMAPWALFLAIEGSWRKIPYLWAYLWLGLSFSLPFGQALFFESMLDRPVSSPLTFLLFRKDKRITDFYPRNGLRTLTPMKSHTKDGKTIMYRRPEPSLHEWYKETAFRFLIEATPVLITVAMLSSFPIGPERGSLFSMWQLVKVFMVTYIPIILRRKLKIFAHRSYRLAVIWYGMLYWTSKQRYSQDEELYLPYVFAGYVESERGRAAMKRMAVEFMISAFIMGTWAFRRGMVWRNGLICLTGARPDLRWFADVANDNENIVLKATDGTHIGRPENPNAAIFTWFITASAGLGASTAVVLCAELLWIY